MWPEDKFFVQRGEGPGGVPWVWIFQWTDYKRKRSDVLEPDSKIANLNRRQRVTESMDAIAGYDTANRRYGPRMIDRTRLGCWRLT